MKDLVKRAIGRVASLAGLYGKLSRLERGLLWGGAVAVALLALVFAAPGADGEWRVVLPGRDGDEARAQRLAAELSRRGIAWREGRGEAGLRAIEVPAGESYRAALELVGRDASIETPEVDWVDAAPGLFDTPERLESRRSEHNRRKVERAILWNHKVKAVSLTLSAAPQVSLLRRSTEGASAAVALSLKPGVGELSRAEAESIRDLVRCAFAIRPESISITDLSGRRLLGPAASGDEQRVAEKEESLRRQVAEELRNLYGRVFGESEFSLSVLVSLSQERQVVQKQEMDRERTFPLETESTVERGGEAASGGVFTGHFRPVTLTETVKSIALQSYEKTKIDVPPGDLRAVSITAQFDLDAVARVEAALTGDASGTVEPGDRRALANSFAAREREGLRTFLGVFKSVNASIVVLPFAKGATEVAAAAPAIASVSASGDAAAAVVDGTAHSPWATIFALGLVLSVVLVLWISIARRGFQRRLPYPRISPARPAADRPGAVGEGPDAGLLDSVGRLSERVRERPEVAASILRVWLHQDSVEPVEEALPS